MQLLAVQAADEARHVEVFTRRALLRRTELGLSGAGGRASLQTLLDEPDFTLASFLLSVLGEGTFLDLLRFLHALRARSRHRRGHPAGRQDEARHVAFGVAHTAHAAPADPAFLRTAARARSSGATPHCSTPPDSTSRSSTRWCCSRPARGRRPRSRAAGTRSQQLQRDMDEGRRRRLARHRLSRRRSGGAVRPAHAEFHVSERVTYQLDGGIATITMDDGKVNALSPAMLTELSAAFDRAEADRAVVILAGREGRFSGGFELPTLWQAGNPRRRC